MSRDTGQRISWSADVQYQIDCMFLSTYHLEDGRHVARLRRGCRRRRREYAPISKTSSHDNHEKLGHTYTECKYGALFGWRPG